MEHHGHHHHVPLETGRRYLAGLVLNFLFVIAEFIFGMLYHSAGLLADAGHNLGDVGCLAISMAAFWLARQKSTPHYTYGFRKSTILASLVNAVILLVIIGFIFGECLQKFIHPEEIKGLPIILIAGIGIIINGITTILFIDGKDHDLNAKGAYLHMFADTLVSVGVVVSGVLIQITRWTYFDPIIGLIIAVVILISARDLIHESIRLVLDGIPCGIDFDSLRKEILEQENILDIHHVHIWPISTTENAMTAHVTLKDITTQENTKKYLRHELSAYGITHSTFEFETADYPCSDTGC